MKNNNSIKISGTITSAPKFSHESYGEKFYTFSILSNRLSDARDEINLTISDRLTDISKLVTGNRISVIGQIRTFNQYHELNKSGKPKLIVFVFVKELVDVCENDENDVVLSGFICKKPQFRVTPLGSKICDILVAVNRAYGKTDYIPVIIWGRNAEFSSNLEVGTLINMQGRLQSRTYTKRFSDTDIEHKTAYEVSISKIQVTVDTDE